VLKADDAVAARAFASEHSDVGPGRLRPPPRGNLSFCLSRLLPRAHFAIGVAARGEVSSGER
jgi:hypothetical protein